MRDDLEITTKIENGKAYLEFTLPEELREQDAMGSGEMLWIRIRDPESGRQVFYGEYDTGETETMTALLLRPHLWNGMRDPYVYEVEACGDFRTDAEGKRAPEAGEETVDNALTQLRWRQKLAIYDLRVIEKKGTFLNGTELELHVVEYSPAGENISQDLEQLARMGANALLLREGEPDSPEQRLFRQDCLERGFLTGKRWITEEEIPVYRGYPGCPDEIYYQYQAKWSTQPVLYPVLSTLRQQPDGALTLTVYSNQKKVALYVEGVLFLFQSGGPEYIFEDIPAAKLPLQLALEAGNLNMALTISRIPSGSHNFHKEITFS